MHSTSLAVFLLLFQAVMSEHQCGCECERLVVPCTPPLAQRQLGEAPGFIIFQHKLSALVSVPDIMQAVAETFHLFFFLNHYQSDLKGKSGRERINERAALLIGS